jgi:hypothetical protein
MYNETHISKNIIFVLKYIYIVNSTTVSLEHDSVRTGGRHVLHVGTHTAWRTR